jgi:hypothetical protein
MKAEPESFKQRERDSASEKLRKLCRPLIDDFMAKHPSRQTIALDEPLRLPLAS